MKFWLNVLASLVVGVVCVAWAWPRPEQYVEIKRALVAIDWRWVVLYLVMLGGVHFFRAWRWEYLLRPMGARIGLGRLLAVSSVGFMAIQTLPLRLGEFVRPYLIAERGRIGMSAAIGTVAVERVVDGLMISLLVFFSFLGLRGPGQPVWPMLAAYGSLALFGAAAGFLVGGVIWPERMPRLAVRLLLVDRVAPRFAARFERFLREVCAGFRVLRDARNLSWFLVGTCAYWALNGAGNWLLARAFALPLPLSAAFATMGLTGVGIMLPNTPGLIGQFHAFMKLGLLLYLPAQLVLGRGMAYVAVLHGIQLLWYCVVGCVCLFSSHASFVRVVRASQAAALEGADKEREAVA